MTAKKKGDPKNGTGLRRQAEERLLASKHDIAAMSLDDVQRLVHELQVHQIELDMQNDELRRTQLELEAVRDRYRDLYDFNPTAHLTMDVCGTIVEANLRAATLLGMDRKDLIGQPLARFFVSEDQDSFHRHCQDVLKTVTQQTCEIRLRRKAGAFSWSQLESLAMPDESGPLTRWRTSLLDITVRKESEQTLRENQQQFQAIINNSPALIFLKDVEGRYLLANRKFEETFHLANGDLIGKTDEDIFPPKLAAVFRANDRTVLEAGESIEFEEVALHDDGPHTSIVVKFPLVNPQGRCYALCGIVTDVTERKQAEALLAAEKKVLELITTGAAMPEVLDVLMRETEAQSTDGMLCSILLLDETGRKLLHGAAPSLPAAYNAATHGLVIGPSVGSCGTAAFERKPVFVNDIAGDPRWTDGKDLAAAHGLGACHSTPILSSQDRILGTIAMYYRRPHNPGAHDRHLIERATQLAGIVIERRQVEEVLRLAKFSMDRAADAVYWIDPQAQVLDVNEAASWMLGYTKDELCAMTVHDLNPDFQADMWPGFWEKTRKHGTMVIETFHKAKNGRLIPIELSVNFLSYEGKEYHCAFVRDITERKQADRQLQETMTRLQNLSRRVDVVREEERTRIARELHDELGVRLTCLKMDLARVPSLVPWHRIEEKVRAMTAEVDSTIASVQRLVAELRPGILDDLGLVAAIEWQCQDFEQRSGIRCCCEARKGDIQLDRPKATVAFRIFQEALTNVARHAKATSIRVLVDQLNGDLLLEIHDDGLGIPVEKLTDSASLDLLGMHERAASLGGQIEIAGQPGNGTTVKLRLPCSKQADK